jgi:hypothetical protein
MLEVFLEMIVTTEPLLLICVAWGVVSELAESFLAINEEDEEEDRPPAPPLLGMKLAVGDGLAEAWTISASLCLPSSPLVDVIEPPLPPLLLLADVPDVAVAVVAFVLFIMSATELAILIETIFVYFFRYKSV